MGYQGVCGCCLLVLVGIREWSHVEWTRSSLMGSVSIESGIIIVIDFGDIHKYLDCIDGIQGLFLRDVCMSGFT